MNVNDLLEYAKQETLKLCPNEIFSLKDLFKGYEWKRIQQGEKCTLGVLYLNYAESQPHILVLKNGNSKLYQIKNQL